MNTIYALTAVLGVVLVVASAAGTFVAFKTSRNTQLIKIYKGTAEAWEQRAAAQADEIKELQANDAAKTAEIADLRGQVTTLKELVTGRDLLETVATKVAHIEQMLESR